MVNELRPPTLVDFGLVNAIQDYAKDFREKFPEIELTIDLNEVINDFDLSEEKSLTLYRIAEESPS